MLAVIGVGGQVAALLVHRQGVERHVGLVEAEHHAADVALHALRGGRDDHGVGRGVLVIFCGRALFPEADIARHARRYHVVDLPDGRIARTACHRSVAARHRLDGAVADEQQVALGMVEEHADAAGAAVVERAFRLDGGRLPDHLHAAHYAARGRARGRQPRLEARLGVDAHAIVLSRKAVAQQGDDYRCEKCLHAKDSEKCGTKIVSRQRIKKR